MNLTFMTSAEYTIDIGQICRPIIGGEFHKLPSVFVDSD